MSARVSISWSRFDFGIQRFDGSSVLLLGGLEGRRLRFARRGLRPLGTFGLLDLPLGRLGQGFALLLRGSLLTRRSVLERSLARL